MENKFYEKWLQELRNELALLEGLEITPLERLRHTLPLISRINGELKEQVLKDGFLTNEAEIEFFKNIKPQFYALQLYEALFYNLQMQAPKGTKDMLKAYYEAELLQVFREFRVNAFQYQYFHNKATELDSLYFLRDAKFPDIPLTELIDPFPGYSTAMDFSFAKFIAYERLQDLLLELITDLYSEQKRSIGKAPVLTWTGDAINLVELAYGIWLTNQVNGGTASITEIVYWLEYHFGIKVGRAYRRWTEISRRKRVSQVKFLDLMRGAVLKRIEEELE